MKKERRIKSLFYGKSVELKITESTEFEYYCEFEYDYDHPKDFRGRYQVALPITEVSEDNIFSGDIYARNNTKWGKI